LSSPFLLVQLSDPHLGADWGGGDPVARLVETVNAARAFEPDAVLLSGDLADHHADAEYEQVRELLARIEAPLYVLPGNHDDRSALRRLFGSPGQGNGPLQYSVDLGPLLLVALDTVRVGDDRGELDAGRLAWLEATLTDAPETPTILALHHPPVTTGIAAVDVVGLPPADQRALGDVVAPHLQVRRIVGGHLHLAIAAELRGRSVLVAPSTYVQAQLDFGADEISLSAEPPGFVVHAFVGGDLVSHVQVVGR
jgi:3',5'-cyclic-AMP phosphodiesterase